MEATKDRNLDIGGHKPGYEWRAGGTYEGDAQPGEWVVKLTVTGWAVVFRPLSVALKGSAARPGVPAGTSMMNGPEYPIHEFPPTESGETAAKTMALKIVDIARGEG